MSSFGKAINRKSEQTSNGLAQYQFNTFRKSLLAIYSVAAPLVFLYSGFFLVSRPYNFSENLSRVLASACIFAMALCFTRKKLQAAIPMTVVLLGLASYIFIAFPAVHALGAQAAVGHLIAMSAIYTVAFIALSTLVSHTTLVTVILFLVLAPFLPVWYLTGWDAVRLSLVLRMLSLALITVAIAHMVKRETESSFYLHQQLLFNSLHDSLSGLLNRRGFYETIERFAADTKVSLPARKLSIIMVDIDHFKSINDTYGHEVGDMVIKQLADALKDYFADSATISRFGGEEFIAAIETDNRQTLLEKSEGLRRKISQLKLHVGSDNIIQYTVSIGIAFQNQQENLQQLLLRADKGLYQAKNQGRNQAVEFSS